MTTFDLFHEGKKIPIDVGEEGEYVLVKVDSRTFRVRIKDRKSNSLLLELNGREKRVEYVDEGSESLTLQLDGRRLLFLRNTDSTAGTQSQLKGRTLISPLPGRVLDIKVVSGQTVEAGDPLIVLESMKMETVVRADRKATVSSVSVNKGEFIHRGQQILSYE